MKIAENLISNGSPVYIGEDALVKFLEALSGFSRVFFLTDFRTLRKCLPLIEEKLPEQLEYHSLVIQEGEKYKQINTCVLLWKQLKDLNAHRNDLFVNVGGGVVCDIGAFVATAFKRGMPFINVPTSLMAMADAAIGGKAAVDMEEVKNQVGLFTFPEGIYIYPQFLETLEKRQINNGMAEVIKHALIADKELWNQILSEGLVLNEELIFRSVEIKTSVVNNDFNEKGRRKILNFGHTIGHALETYSMRHSRNPLLHGEAVAMGIICEAFLSKLLNKLPGKAYDEIRDFILKQYEKFHFPKDAIPELFQIALQDKKNESDGVNFSLLSDAGSCDYNIYCSKSDFSMALEELLAI